MYRKAELTFGCLVIIILSLFFVFPPSSKMQDECSAARKAEYERHNRLEKQLSEKRRQIYDDHNARTRACGRDERCKKAALEEFNDRKKALSEEKVAENKLFNHNKKAIFDRCRDLRNNDDGEIYGQTDPDLTIFVPNVYRRPRLEGRTNTNVWRRGDLEYPTPAPTPKPPYGIGTNTDIYIPKPMPKPKPKPKPKPPTFTEQLQGFSSVWWTERDNRGGLTRLRLKYKFTISNNAPIGTQLVGNIKIEGSDLERYNAGKAAVVSMKGTRISADQFEVTGVWIYENGKYSPNGTFYKVNNERVRLYKIRVPN